MVEVGRRGMARLVFPRELRVAWGRPGTVEHLVFHRILAVRPLGSGSTPAPASKPSGFDGFPVTRPAGTFRVIGITEPYEFIWLGDRRGPEPYKFIEFGVVGVVGC